MFTFTFYIIIGFAVAYWLNKNYIAKWVEENQFKNETKYVILGLCGFFWPLVVAYYVFKRFLS